MPEAFADDERDGLEFVRSITASNSACWTRT
jgi:hypothetical protein